LASETELMRLALAAYEAAAEPTLWPGFMQGFTQALSADMAVLQIHDLGRHVSTILSDFGLTSLFTKSYNDHYSKQNVWREQGRALYAAGRVNLSEELCPRPLLERSEFYNDYLLRLGGVYSIGAVIKLEENRAPTITGLRGRRKSQFGEPEREVARFLLPHLTRAWTIQERLHLLSAGESVLDTLPLGVVFLAAGGSAVYWNRAAEDMFRANDGLLLRNGVLSAADRSANTQLRKAIHHALSPGRTPGPAAVPVPRASLRREYQILAAPLRARFQQFAGMPIPMAVALMTDPERQRPATVDLLIQMYQLTPREAALGGKLSEGKSVKQAAEELSISYETARTHLRRIFSKTGTSRQAELLVLIDQLPTTAADQNG
jgi:DNA-binding CsgD family transcriptional regulator